MNVVQEPLALQVRVVGFVRGHEIDQPATAGINGSAVVLSWTNATPWQLDLAGIEGFAATADMVTLYLRHGDFLELRGNEDVSAFAAALSHSAHEMPELTRGLRALGSLRGVPGPAHDRWFAPLIAARRRLEGANEPLQQLALVDAGELRREMERAIEELAAINAPGGGAERRALEAAMEDEAEGVFRALAAFERKSTALRKSAVDTRLAVWRQWIEALRDVFAAADDCWPRCGGMLRRD